MGGVVRQSCRIERWRGYVASSFYVCLPDGTRLESSSFKWRRASAPPESGDARAAYDELAERLGALGWERGTDGEEWFAAEFTRFVEAPLAPEPAQPEPEPEMPPAPAQVAVEPVEHEPVRLVLPARVGEESIERELVQRSELVEPEPEPALPLGPAHVAAESVVREPAPARVAAESIERELLTRLPSGQVATEVAEPAPVRSLPPLPVEPEPLASVHVAPPVVRGAPAPEPAPAAPVVQPQTAPRRIPGPSPLQLALRRAWAHALETTRGLFGSPIRTPRAINVFLGIAVVAVVAVVWAVVFHSLTKPPKPAPVLGRPNAVVWGNRVFTSRAELAHWLSSRGLSYNRWAKTHPEGVRIIDAGTRR